jgi:hypothetical protein
MARKFLKIEIVKYKKWNYAKEEYCNDTVAAGEAGLLRGVSAAGVGAEVCGAAEELEGDACVLRDYGGADATRREGAGEPEGQQPPLAPAM